MSAELDALKKIATASDKYFAERRREIEESEAAENAENKRLGLTLIQCAVRADGWLFIKHGDGQWVSAAQLVPFSMSILRKSGSIE